MPTAAYITTMPTGTPRTVVPLSVWCSPLSRSQGGYCSTGPRARAAIRGSSPNAGPSPTPRSGGCRPRAGARTASGRSGSCPRGSAATPACAAVQHVFPIRLRLASRRIPTRRCIHTARTALPSQPHPALSPYWYPPGRRSSHRTPRIPATCRRPARSGRRGPSSTRPGCTQSVRRPGRGVRP